jgi:hypothetical protein
MAEGGGTVGYLAKRNPNGVSVHYVVEYGGRVVRMLDESHINGSINPRDIRTTDDPPYTYLGDTVVYGDSAARAALGIWWDDPNRATIGIEVEGFAKDGPNAKQTNSLVALVRDIRTRHPRAGLLGHRDFADYKACPGKRVNWAALGGHGEAASTGGDMAIDAAPGLTTGYRLDVPKGTTFYADADCTERYGPFESAASVVYVGASIGEAVTGGSRAILRRTAYPYPDGTPRDTVVYVRSSDVPKPYAVPSPEPEPQPYDVIVGGKPVGSVTLP